MFAEVITLAFRDMRNGDYSARSFLTDQSGQWAQSREVICDAAGVDPDAVLRKAKAIIALPPTVGMQKAEAKRLRAAAGPKTMAGTRKQQYMRAYNKAYKFRGTGKDA